MQHVHGPDGILLLNHAADVNLARTYGKAASVSAHPLTTTNRTLGYHFNINIRFGQRTKHLPGNANHVFHLLAHQTQNGQVSDHIDGSVATQLSDRRPQRVVLDFRVQGHRHMHLGCGDKVDAELVLVQDREYPGQEAVAQGLAVGVHIEDYDVVLGGDGRWSLRARLQERVVRPIAEVSGDLGRGLLALAGQRIGKDHGAVAGGIFDVLYPDGDACPYDLFHGEWMDNLVDHVSSATTHPGSPNLGSIVGEFGSLFRRDDGDQSCSDDFLGVCRKYSIHLLPHLELVRVEAHGQQGRAQVGVPAPNRAQQASGDDTEITFSERPPSAVLVGSNSGNCEGRHNN